MRMEFVMFAVADASGELMVSYGKASRAYIFEEEAEAAKRCGEGERVIRVRIISEEPS